MTWLLVIDLPDERVGGRAEFDHMHSWFESLAEARVMRSYLEERFGSGRVHEIIEQHDRSRCPRCGRYMEEIGIPRPRRTKKVTPPADSVNKPFEGQVR